jgi:parallel beta-helix repeat protein
MSLPFLVSTDFDFEPIYPGGTLTAGTPVTFPIPISPGLATGNYIYISGGIGTAEAVQLTDVRGTQITFTPANNHSGNWSIRSATAGIQEAVVSNQVGAHIYIPQGTHYLYSQVNLPNIGKSFLISGAGSTRYNDPGSASRLIVVGGHHGFYLDNSVNLPIRPLRIEHLSIRGQSVYESMGELDGIHIINWSSTQIEDVSIQAMAGNGIWFDQSAGVLIDKCDISGNGKSGIYMSTGANGSVIRDNSITANCRAGDDYASIQLWSTPGNTSGPVLIEGNILENNAEAPYPGVTVNTEWNLRATRVLNLNVIGNYFDDQIKRQYNVYVDGTCDVFIFIGNLVLHGEVYVDSVSHGLVSGNHLYDSRLNVNTPYRAEVAFSGNSYRGTAHKAQGVNVFTREHVWYGFTAPPTAGSWEVSDIVWNVSPATGRPIGWVCTVAGTPGTWRGFGVIS